jgi:hypothetical protein
MAHWSIDDIDWDRFDATQVDPAVVLLIKAAALVERNGIDYATYLKRVFADDPVFQAAADDWAVEEVRHGDTLGRWAMLADPSWDYMAAFERFRAGYQVNLTADASVRGSRTGELIARCIVETGTSSYYTALGERSTEPALRQLCKKIAADEFRHFKLFYDHMRLYLERERIGGVRRIRIAAGRITESEDDELAFAYHCANDDPGTPYDRARCFAAYGAGTMAQYRFRDVERGMGMVFKAVGLKPRGRLSDWAAKGAWALLRWRQARLAARIGLPPARFHGAFALDRQKVA